MTEILKQFERNRLSQFLPSTPDEYFALRLARGLGEPQAANHYAILASQYSQHKLLCAYQRAIGAKHTAKTPAKIFHEYLESIPPGGSNGIARPKLMAVRIERRCIAVGIFTGTHLDGFRARALAADHDAADSTAVAFLRECLSDCECRTIAVETVAGDIRRSILHEAVLATCRSVGVSVWEISIKTVMESLAYPPPKTREEIRKQVLRMWPLPGLKRAEQCALDAFAVGLHVQTERLFGADTMNGH